MAEGVEDFLKQYGRVGRVRNLPELSPLPFNRPSGPSSGACRPPSNSLVSPTFSNISAISSSSRTSDGDSASRRSSTSTASSTAPSIQRFGPPPWHNHRGMNPIVNDYDYRLPCEFAMLGCDIAYHPERYEDWIDHSISHFMGNPLPSITLCTFCDDPAAYVRYQNPLQTWRARMIHIGLHHWEYRGRMGPRPDFFLVEHLKQCGLMVDVDYEDMMAFTERQFCDNLVDSGFKSPEMEERERKNAKPVDERHDLRKERRQIRQEKGKGRSGRSTYKSTKSSRNPEVKYEPRS